MRQLRFALPATIATAVLLHSALATPLGAQERHVLTGTNAIIWNLAGEIRLEAGTAADVVVEVTRGGSEGRRLDVSASGGQLKIRYPDNDIVYRDARQGRSSTTLTVRDDGTFDGDWGSGGRRVRIRSYGDGFQAHADLRVMVPKGRRVEVHLAMGEVSVTNVDGDLSIDVHSANVRAVGTRGRFSVDAGSGSVRVEDAADGDLNVDTGSGSTTLTNVRMRSVEIDAGSGSVTAREVTAERLMIDVGSGSIRVEGLATDDLRVETGSGGVDLALTKVPRSTDIDTGSGSVRIELPAAVNADVDIETGSGGISSEFAVTMDEVRRRELRGRIGTGGAVLRVNTGSGGVRLLKR